MLAPASTDDATIAAGREAWQRLRSGRDWADWLKVGYALVIGRDHALSTAKTDKPFGKRYVQAFASWLRQHELDAIHKSVRGVLLQIIDNLDKVEQWRASLPERQQAKVNHPDTVWRGYGAAQHGFGDDAACRHPPSRYFVIWPDHARERARRKVERIIASHGVDFRAIVNAALTGALPHGEDLDELVKFQAPRPLGRPPQTRPPSPAIVLLDSTI